MYNIYVKFKIFYIKHKGTYSIHCLVFLDYSKKRFVIDLCLTTFDTNSCCDFRDDDISLLRGNFVFHFCLTHVDVYK